MILADARRIARHAASGAWATRTLDDLFRSAVRAHPGREALVDPPDRAAWLDGEPRRLDWRSLGDEVARLAGLLRDEGCKRDDVVLVQLPEAVEQVVVHLALLRLGCIVSPVPLAWRESELRPLLATAAASAAITTSRIGTQATADVWCRLAREREADGAADGELDLQVFAFGRDVPVGALPLDLALDGVDPDDSVEAAPPGLGADDIATVCWAAGHPLAPKGVPRSHNEWLAGVPSIVAAAGLTSGARILSACPLAGAAGWSVGMAAWLSLGGTLVCHQPRDMATWIGQLRAEGVDYALAPPSILDRMLQDAHGLDGIDFARLPRLGSGGAAASAWMVRGWADRGVRIVDHYASTEGALLTSGRLPATSRARLVDPETGRTIAEPGRAGELRVGGPTVCAGYFRAPALTDGAFDADGLLRTGDLFEAVVDEADEADGEPTLRFVGRLEHVVVRGGVRLAAEEIEALLLMHPEVAEAAVVGVPDAVLGERIGAAVVPRAGRAPTPEGVLAWLSDTPRAGVERRAGRSTERSMERSMEQSPERSSERLPERLLVLAALPRQASGRVARRELRARLAAVPLVRDGERMAA